MAQTQAHTGPTPPLYQPQPLHQAPSRHITRSGSSGSLGLPQNVTLHQMAGHQPSQLRSSRTWTTSSGDLGLLSDTDEVEDRAIFVQEYNRLAKKHGVRILVVEDFEPRHSAEAARTPEKRRWFHRMLRSASNNPPPIPPKSNLRPPPRHKRSVSDLAHNLVRSMREPPTVMDVQDMVRLSGKSALYLPHDYSPCSLILPTCLRATAQYLAQNITTRGLFRIPGSARVVNALYDYYCYMDNAGGDIASTVRCVNLPAHIATSVHDVASTFKRLLSALQGGILGSLSIFDAFVAIHAHLHGDPEFPRTKQTKVRARLIALAIGTIKSQFRRELICAVLGLLSLIGRVAEVSPREDQDGRPLPTADLMGYHALGIVFGPLLVGELLDSYEMKLATPTSGLLVFPHTPQKLRRPRPKSRGLDLSPGPPTVDKILVAINITEMLISNWRDVVRQMRTLGTHNRRATSRPGASNPSLRPSVSESLAVKRPGDWEQSRGTWKGGTLGLEGSSGPENATIGVKRQRLRPKKSAGSFNTIRKPSFNMLSPTAEENLAHEEVTVETEEAQAMDRKRDSPFLPAERLPVPALLSKHREAEDNWESLKPVASPPLVVSHLHGSEAAVQVQSTELKSPRACLDDIPPRTSSKQAKQAPCSSSAQGWRSSSEETQSDISQYPDKEVIRQSGGAIQRNRWPNKKVSSDVAAASPDAGSFQAPGPVAPIPTIHRSDTFTHPTRASTGSSLGQAPGSVLSPKDLGNGRKDTGPSPLHVEESTRFWMQENANEPRNTPRGLAHHKVSGGSLRSCGYSAISSDQNFGPHGGSKRPEQSETMSIHATPRSFYSPMRVPPELVGYRDIEADDSPRRSTRANTSTGNDHRKPSREELANAASRVARQSDAWFSTIRTPHEGAGLSRTKPAMTKPRILEAQNRFNTQPRPGESSTTRPSVTAVAGHHGSVRAMAARFEGQESIQGAASGEYPEKQAGRTQSLASQYSHRPASKPLRSTQSGPPWTPQVQKRPSWTTQPQPILRTMSSNSQGKRDSTTATHDPQPLPAGESVAARAAALMDAEKRQQEASQPPRPYPKRQKTSTPVRKPELEAERGFPDQTLKDPPSLGTMVPYLEQPPVAHHLNLPRPVSSASSLQPQDEGFPQNLYGSTTPTPRPGSTSILHSQIRNLQRQLDAKIEEAAQLRRQVEAQEGSDVGTLSEQLREAKRELAMWKERAESAERRVKVFERFTSRLRGIREAAAVPGQQGTDLAGREWPDQDDNHGFEMKPHQHIKGEGRLVAKESTGDDSSDDSGRTEDAGVVTARIRTCLHGSPGNDAEISGQENKNTLIGETPGYDGTNSIRAVGTRDISRGAVEIWIAAQELLQLEGGSAHGADGFF